MKRFFENYSLYLIMLLAVILLAMSAFITYNQYNQSINNFLWVNHTNEVLREINSLQSKVYKAEGETRTFLLLHERNLTPPIKLRRTETLAILDNIQRLVDDNEIQKDRLDSLNRLLNSRFDLMNITNRKAQSGVGISAEDILAGRTLTDSLMRIISNMTNNEYDLLRQRHYASLKTQRTSPYFLIGSAMLSIVLILFTFLVLNRQMAARRKLFFQLQKKITEVERSNSELEQFAYVASHDLQEPLRKLRTFGDRLSIRESNNLSADGKEMIAKMNGFAMRMQKLIDDLLQFSRVVNTKVEMQEVDLNFILTEVRTNLSAIIVETRAVITLARLPKIKGYELQLMQLFQNILSNSLKYRSDVRQPEIKIVYQLVEKNSLQLPSHLDHSKQFHRITVTDNGIGFDNQYAEKIFTIFQRLHGRNEYEGTGIGLAITKAVMANHGGAIEAVGRPGEGATFILFFPA
ncbi:MAG: ATP-binding protein [Chitinophagales bacterium]